jgi:hypothetical protein
VNGASDRQAEIAALFESTLLPVPEDLVRVALAGRREASEKLDALRRVPLSYVPTYVEPLHALRWIERTSLASTGGRTDDGE